jgi:hypothetical protein
MPANSSSSIVRFGNFEGTLAIDDLPVQRLKGKYQGDFPI